MEWVSGGDISGSPREVAVPVDATVMGSRVCSGLVRLPSIGQYSDSAVSGFDSRETRQTLLASRALDVLYVHHTTLRSISSHRSHQSGRGVNCLRSILFDLPVFNWYSMWSLHR